MGGAYLVAGGNTLAHALAGLDAQMAQAAQQFDMAPVGPVHVAVAAGCTDDPDLVGRTVQVVPAAANTDWDGAAWPFVASVHVHN